MTDKIKGMDFEHEMTTTSHIFGRDADVHVVFEGDVAKTDKDVIVLPAIDPMADIDPAAAAVARGYVDHEAAHKRYTDFDLIEKMTKTYGPMGQHILNGIEDVRLAKLTIADYVGAKDNLNATTRAVDERLLKGWEDGAFKERPAQDFLPLAIAWQGYKALGMGHAEACLANVDKEVTDLAGEVAGKIDALTSTKDAFDLAVEVCKRIKLEEQEDDDDEGDEREGEPGGEGRLAWNFDEFQPIREGDASGAVSDMLRNFAGGKHKHYRGCYEQDNFIDRKTKPECYVSTYHAEAFKEAAAGWQSRFNVVTTQGGYVHAVKRRLEALLFAETERGWNPAQMRGRIDSKRLTQAVLGSETVFKTRMGLPDIDTAVSVLVDMSGSMSGSKINLAADVATLLSEALHKTGVAFEVTGFHNVGHYFRRTKALPPGFRKLDWDAALKDFRAVSGGRSGRGEFAKDEISFEFAVKHAGVRDWEKLISRNQPMDYVTFKSFDERLSDARASIQAIRHLAGGNNSDGDALMEQYRRIKKRREKRRIMMVLSDGAPACGHNEASHLSRVAKMIDADPKIEMVGIGIMDASVTHFYKRHAVCNNLKDLSTTVMDQLTLALKRGAAMRQAA